MKWPKPRQILLFGSLLLNVALLGWIGLDRFNAPSGRLGRLEKDITAVSIADRGRLPFRLPKGLTVRDESPRGLAAAGMFEPYRFAIVITTEDEKVVNYGIPENQLNQFGELYTMDLDAARSY
jgi:hypothetical protein